MKHKLTKEQWLDNALIILNKEGFGPLNIDRLVRAMGLTKGSFYWHFSNRKEFVENLVEHWNIKFTDTVIKHIENFEGTERERLLELMLLITRKQLAQYDFAIHALAQNEPQAFPLIKEVLRKRFAYVASLFFAMGFKGNELKFRSRATVMFMTQEQNSLLKESKEVQLKRIRLAHSLFTKP
jgi:AcrR family transcriptional regulator